MFRRRKASPARVFALLFGIGFVALAIIEDVVGRKGLKIGGHLAVERTTAMNILHWAVGIVLLIAWRAGELPSRWAARLVGLGFLALTVWGFVARKSLGKAFGFHQGASRKVPLSYDLIDLGTAILALGVGFFAATRSSRRGRFHF